MKVQDVDALLNDIRIEVDKGVGIEVSEEKHERYRNYQEYLFNLKKKISKDKLKYVFIGEKGKGKTTTILNLFALKSFDKELLATGAGGTTVCEVELLPSEEEDSFIEIIPIEDKYMEQYLYDFCSTFKKDGESNEIHYVPTEIARSIRNMIKLKANEVRELYSEINDFNTFYNEIKTRLNLQNRNQTIIRCKSNNEGQFFDDIQRKFNQINLGKVEEIKIPNKIILHITKDVLDFSKFNSIESVVDTRGIDGSVGKENEKNKDSFRREDILNYIDKQQDECIFLFIDGIKAAPTTDILDTIRSRITRENADRFYLFINIYHDEAENVVTDDGPAETAENGIEYKREDIISKFKQEKIPFKESNLIFFNSKKNIPSADEILNTISNNIGDTKEEILQLSNDVMIAFNKLKYDYENNEAALEYFEELYEKVAGIVPSKNIVEEIKEDFVDEKMAKVHSSRLNAINRAYGDYILFNFFHHYSLAIERAFDRIYLEAKNDVIKKVNEFLNYRNITKLEEIDYKAFLDKVQRDYLEQRSNVTAEYKKMFKEIFNNQSWNAAKSEYGKGSGQYTKNVCEIYASEINRLDEILPFRDSFNKAWTEVIESNNLVKKESSI